MNEYAIYTPTQTLILRAPTALEARHMAESQGFLVTRVVLQYECQYSELDEYAVGGNA